jgi:alpha-glucosidase (family GH31 glycosyl hydrolase)
MAYKSELELRAVVDSMQHAGFPMDAVIIDLNWFGQFENGGKTNMGNLDWDRVYWPQAEKMIADFQKRNVKTVLITEPFFLKETSNYDLLDNLNLLATDKKGKSYVFDNFYFGKAGLLDIFKPAAQQWFWLQYKKHINTGVAGWWGDLGEPEIHPSDVLHLWGKAEMVHNIYAHYWSKTLADGYRTDFPKQRLFNLNRSGFAGSQRFSVFPWTGDVSRSWVGLQAQLPIMLSMSLSGMAYTHSDLGGFAGGVADPELYVRWLQMGVFSPIFRPHGSKIPSEPVMWDAHTQELSMKAIRLRYSLLPYIYTLAWKNATEGLPLVRPVWYDGTSGVDGLGIDDAFFFGADLLVAPIMKAQQHTRRVYLPRGNWYEFRGTAKFVGDSWVEVPVVEDQIPVFARGGSFVPMLNRQIQSTATYDVSSLQLHYYLGSKGHVAYSLFDDDGVTEGTLKYRNYQLLNFEMDELPNELLFAMDRDGEFPGSTLVHEMELVVHGVSSPPTEVRYGDKLLAKEPYLKRFGNAQYAWCYDEISASLFIRFVYLGVGKQTVRIVR